MKLGIIADTHGLLRQEIIEIFKGCDLIFHAGDIGKRSIIDELEEIAPVIVVRGNNDKDDWGQSLPHETYTKAGSKIIYMIHNLKESQAVFETRQLDIVISGHSHIYTEKRKEDILYLNPGSAGPKRFGRPANVMLLEIENGIVAVQKITL